MDNNVGMAQRYEHEIPEGYEARIEDNKVIFEPKESEDEGIRKFIIYCIDEELKPIAEFIIHYASWRAFKAGAEWMAGQFQKIEGELVDWYSSPEGKDYCCGVKTIDSFEVPEGFYIRKK